MRADGLDDGVERRRIADRQLAEHLAVQRDAGCRQRGDEAVVVHAALLQGGIEARDPQRSEVTLLLPAVAPGVLVGLAGELQRLAVQRTGAGAEAGGTLQHALAFTGMSRAACGAGHGRVLSNFQSQISNFRFQISDFRFQPFAWALASVLGRGALGCFPPMPMSLRMLRACPSKSSSGRRSSRFFLALRALRRCEVSEWCRLSL